jgi:hypothetical protein
MAEVVLFKRGAKCVVVLIDMIADAAAKKAVLALAADVGFDVLTQARLLEP